MYDILFLRKLEQRSLLTLNVRRNEATHGGEMFGSLDTSSTRLSIGIITKELGTWLLALRFVPVDFTWICIFDKTWKNYYVVFSQERFSLMFFTPLSSRGYITFKQSNFDNV